MVQPSHPLRGGDLRFVWKPVLPLGRSGAAPDALVVGLRRLLHLAARFVSARAGGRPDEAHKAWLEAVKVTPRPSPVGWSQHRGLVRKWPRCHDAQIYENTAAWNEIVIKADARAAAARKRSWDEWVDKAYAEQGGARVFRFIRGPAAPTAVTPATPASGVPAPMCSAGMGLQTYVEGRCDFWEALWCPQDLINSHAALPAQLRALPVPLPTADELRGLLRSYRWRTAVGADHWQPRSLELLPDSALSSLMELCRFMLLTGCIPKQFALLLVVLIPKPEGGERPIGIFPSVLRIVDRWFRWQYGAAWIRQNASSAFYGTRGQTVEDAVWRQGLLAEWSAVFGRPEGSCESSPRSCSRCRPWSVLRNEPGKLPTNGQRQRRGTPRHDETTMPWDC